MTRTTIKFEGKVTTVTSDGCAAVVTLPKKVEGMNRAIISPDTRGRVRLMNGIGRLLEGIVVQGEAVKGVDGLRAISVEQLD